MYTIEKQDYAFGCTSKLIWTRTKFDAAQEVFIRCTTEAKYAIEEGSKHKFTVTLLDDGTVIDEQIFEPEENINT